MKFLAIVLSIPFILMCLYFIFYPKESALWGNRWQFKNEDLEPSDAAIKYNRFAGIFGLIIIVMLLLGILFDHF